MSIGMYGPQLSDAFTYQLIHPILGPGPFVPAQTLNRAKELS